MGFAMTYLLIIATGYGDIMAFTLRSIIHIGGNSADAHNMKARLAFVAVCMGMVYTNIFRPMMEDGNRPNQKEKDKNRWEKN